MTPTLDYELRTTSTLSDAPVIATSTSSRATSTSVPKTPKGLPLSIPSSQVYYWSRSWQRDELIALDEISSGDTQRFEGSRDALRWLLSDDD